MKLCITSSGKDLEAKTDARFGRAAYFLLIDTATNSLEVLENTAAADIQGAGIAAAQQILTKEVEGVLTGRLGPNAMEVFQKAGVTVYEGISSEDTVKEALARFTKGELSDTTPSQQVPPRGQGGGRGSGRGMGGGGGQGRGMGGGGGQGRGTGGGGGRGR